MKILSCSLRSNSILTHKLITYYERTYVSDFTMTVRTSKLVSLVLFPHWCYGCMEHVLTCKTLCSHGDKNKILIDFEKRLLSLEFKNKQRVVFEFPSK